MQTVIIEINNPKALALLQELEELNVLKIVKDTIIENKIKLSDKYNGVFSKTDALEFDKHSQTIRKEWDNI